MRKFLVIAMLFLASALAFGQDGRTKVNFVNRTDSTLRFFLNNSPACTGDVIPGGFCTEPVNPGSYTAWATNGQQRTGGQSFDIADGETYTYTVSLQATQMHNTNPALRTIALLSYRGAVADAPIDLSTDGSEARKTDEGKDYTQTTWIGTLPNNDTYFVSVAEYPFTVDTALLGVVINRFATGAGGKVLTTTDAYVSGMPAKAAIVEATTTNGRTLRIAFLATIRGNKAYMFAFASYLDVQDSDMSAMKHFFASARIQ